MHYRSIADAILFKVNFQLREIPFASVVFSGRLSFALVCTSCLDIVLTFFVDRIIGKVNVSFFCRFLAIGVFLCGESCQSFLEQIYF